jgi:hypothetical protein
MWKSIVNYYNTNTTFHGFVSAIEGGAGMGLMMATANGFDFSKKGLTALGTAVLGGVGIAVRNWLKNRPGQPAVPIS